MAKTVDDGFRTFLSWLTPTTSQVIGASKHRESVKSALEAKITLYRFFQTGSFSNGTGVRHYSDVDYFATLTDRPASSTTALNKVRDVLATRFWQTDIYVRRPAVIVNFGDDGSEKYEVVPAYLKSGSGDDRIYRIAGPDGGWIEAAPDAHLGYVREVDQKHNGKAKALARLLKAWKYYRNVPISSFYLEMRAAAYAKAESTILCSIDLRLLLSLDPPKRTYEMTRLRWSEPLSRPLGPSPIR